MLFILFYFILFYFILFYFILLALPWRIQKKNTVDMQTKYQDRDTATTINAELLRDEFFSEL